MHQVEKGKNKLFSMAIEEHGTYTYFDNIAWQKKQKKMTIVYDRLELPPWDIKGIE